MTERNIPVRVSVAGSSHATARETGLAEETGRLLAERGAILVCGGLGGVMEAACRGARSASGMTIGILPGTNPESANPHVLVPIATGLGEARNVLVATSSDALIAIGGELGTLSEISLALRSGIPVVGIDTWLLDDSRMRHFRMHRAAFPAEAVETVFRLIK
jgi:uncharacterized protein (TIGR00725 family)